MTEVAHSLEVLTIGRVSVDLYGSQVGADWNNTSSFQKAVGGTATNVAVAAVRLGHAAAVFTKVGDDPFGTYVRTRLEEFGVDVSYVGVSEGLPTPLALAALDPPEDPQLIFYRCPKAPDLTLTRDDIDLGVVVSVPVLWLTGSSLGEEPARSTILSLTRERGRRSHTVVDLDYRATLWPSESEARSVIPELLEYATVVLGNRTECEIAVGTRDPNDIADRLLDRGVGTIMVKMGGDGVLVATAESRISVPPLPVPVLCGLGAGDGFGGAVIHGLLRGWSELYTGQFANAAGALVASRLLCSDAMGTEEEILSLMEDARATI